ncbi:MAG: hypothetical protein NTV15_04140 [Candidatus Bathyarchaeota archaeon]|nr:hypothetical protein [Candidatus Bathyarchaeota archaeon]
MEAITIGSLIYRGEITAPSHYKPDSIFTVIRERKVPERDEKSSTALPIERLMPVGRLSTEGTGSKPMPKIKDLLEEAREMSRKLSYNSREF